jgi:hypothetical protein
VLPARSLLGKLVTVDGLAACDIALSDVAALAQEPGIDHAVERGPLVALFR